MALQKIRSFQANEAYETSLDVVMSQTCFEIDWALMYYQTHISNFTWNCWRVSADSGDAFIWLIQVLDIYCQQHATEDTGPR